jgi:CelD/BcsL family acetyltransferase involved in cellulose biosynthesis
MANVERTVGSGFASYPFQSVPEPRTVSGVPPLRLGRSGGDFASSGAVGPVEIVVYGLLQAGDHHEAWRDLAQRSLDRNVFYEPDFALAAARHLREAPRPIFVFAWDTGRPRGDAGSLLGVLPVTMPSLGLGTLELFGWRHDQAVLGTPLLDRDRAGEVFTHFLGWLAGATPMAGGILLPMQAEEGATARVIREVCERTGRMIRSFGAHERAVLRGGEAADALLARAMPGKRLKEHRRLRRRLEEKGAVAFVSASSPADVRLAAEVFLEVEEAGWKGRDGGAFLHTASGASFLRAATRSLAAAGECRIDMLTLDGVPIAAGIVLGGAGANLYWKTAFDERFAAFSPGVQLTLEITRRQLENPAVAVTDSCAVAEHPMINGLWPDRMTVSDWFIPASPSRATVGVAVARETAARGLHGTAKALYDRVKKGRKASR